jgi:hypothetical protein
VRSNANVADLGGELRVLGELELAHPVWLQAVRTPEALHRADADAGQLGHRLGGPVRRLARRVPQSQGDDALGHVGPERWDARTAGLVPEKAVDAFLHEPFLPAPDGRLADTGGAHNLGRARAIGGQQHDPGAPHVFLGAVPVRQERAEQAAIGGAHPPDRCTVPLASDRAAAYVRAMFFLVPHHIRPRVSRALCLARIFEVAKSLAEPHAT